MLQSENPFNPVPVTRFPRNPPRNAPTMPIRIVTMTPPGSLPGMIAFAIAPAMRPSTIHAKIPIPSPPKIGGRTAPRGNATDVPEDVVLPDFGEVRCQLSDFRLCSCMSAPNRRRDVAIHPQATGRQYTTPLEATGR